MHGLGTLLVACRKERRASDILIYAVSDSQPLFWLSKRMLFAVTDGDDCCTICVPWLYGR